MRHEPNVGLRCCSRWSKKQCFSDEKEKVLFSETVFHRIGPRVSQDRTFSKNQRSHSKETPWKRAIQGQTGEDVIAPGLMGHVAISFYWKEFLFHRGCSFYLKSIFDAGLIAGGKERKEGHQTVLHSIRSQERRDWRKNRWWVIKAEKSSLQEQVETLSGRSLLDSFGQGTRKRTAHWADKISRSCCLRFCSGRLHRKSGVQRRRKNSISEPLHASASSEDNLQGCHNFKAAAATAGHIEEDRETCSGAEPRHLQQRQQREHRESCCGGWESIQCWSHNSRKFQKMQHVKIKNGWQKIEELVDKLWSEHHTESIVTNLGKKGKFKKFSEGSKDTVRKLGTTELYELGQISKTVQFQACLKYAPEGSIYVCLSPRRDRKER